MVGDTHLWSQHLRPGKEDQEIKAILGYLVWGVTWIIGKGVRREKKRKQEKKGSVWVSGETLRLSIIDFVIWTSQESPGLVLQGCPFLRHPGHRSDTQREGLGCRAERCPGWQEDSHAAFLRFVFLAFKTGMLDRLHRKTQLLSGEAWINS